MSVPIFFMANVWRMIEGKNGQCTSDLGESEENFKKDGIELAAEVKCARKQSF